MPRPQRIQPNAEQGLVEIIEILPDVPGQSGDDDFADGVSTLGAIKIDGVDDPLYQAFVATGLLRPR